MGARIESDRRRATFGLAVLTGTLLAFPAGVWLVPVLGSPAGFIALGSVVGAPVFLVSFRRLGAIRALLLAVLTAGAAAAIFTLLVFGACVVTGCVG